MKKISTLILISALTMLTACGGGGSNIPVTSLPSIVNGSTTDPNQGNDPNNNQNQNQGNDPGNNPDPNQGNNQGNDPIIINQGEDHDTMRQKLLDAINDYYSAELGGVEFSKDDEQTSTRYGSSVNWAGRATPSDVRNSREISLAGESINLSYTDFGILNSYTFGADPSRPTYKIQEIKPIYAVRSDKTVVPHDNMIFSGKAFAVLRTPETVNGGIISNQAVIPGTAELNINVNPSTNVLAKEEINFGFDNWYNMTFEKDISTNATTIKSVEKSANYVERPYGSYTNMDVIDEKYTFGPRLTTQYVGENGNVTEAAGRVYFSYEANPVDITFGVKKN